MSTTTTSVLKIMNVIFWIIFIGLCIKTGAIMFSFIVSLFINDLAARNLYMGFDLSQLYAYDQLQYIFIVSYCFAITALQAYIAYLVIRIFLKFNFSNPFNENNTALITKISHVALGTGIIAILAGGHADWLEKKGIPVAENWGGGEFLFLAGIIFIIAQIFKRGTELQSETDLTV